MTQITIDIEKLGEAVARHIPPTVKDHEELWNSEQCAAYLGICNAVSFTQYTASLPSFPDRIEIPSTRGKRGQLRWVAAEVKEWALSHRRKRKA
jgi:predicted DNA-binding transcriptional regulator AlpA